MRVCVYVCVLVGVTMVCFLVCLRALSSSLCAHTNLPAGVYVHIQKDFSFTHLAPYWLPPLCLK